MAGDQCRALRFMVAGLNHNLIYLRTGLDSNLRPFGSRANVLPLSHIGCKCNDWQMFAS